MFGNLVESSSHKRDNARKGWFFLGTLGVYAVAFLAIGVGSIYAYNTHIETQNLELISMVTPVEAPREEAPPVRDMPERPSRGNDNRPAMSIRTANVAPTTDPTRVPVGVSTTPETVPPPTPGLPPVIGDRNEDIGGGGPGRRGNGSNPFGSDGAGTRNISRDVGEVVPEPPPPAMERRISKPVSKGVVNGMATSLPKPVYSAIAKAAGASGLVTVQVLIDEHGKGISARALSGHPLLQREAVQAALQARFTPTYLSDQPVKVSGVITYNFVRQ